MAELAAGVIGISTFGIQLTRTLYEFGSTASSAKEQTDYIARHVTLYASVLDLLSERIDEEDPILSSKAYDLVEELGDQSYNLFHKIEKLLPVRGKDDLTFFEKIKWNFKKSKVELLVGELDYLKSTVHLLVSVIFAGKRIRSYNKPKTRTNKRTLETEKEKVQTCSLKAQNAIVEHLDASEQLPILKEEADRQERDEIEPSELLPRPSSECNAVVLVSRQNDAIASFQNSLALVNGAAKRRKTVLDNSVHLLHDLLLQWTTVNLGSIEDQFQSSEHEAATGPHQVQPGSRVNLEGNTSASVWRSAQANIPENQTPVKDDEPIRVKQKEPSSQYSKLNPSINASTNTSRHKVRRSDENRRSWLRCPYEDDCPAPGWFNNSNELKDHIFYHHLFDQPIQEHSSDIKPSGSRPRQSKSRAGYSEKQKSLFSHVDSQEESLDFQHQSSFQPTRKYISSMDGADDEERPSGGPRKSLNILQRPPYNERVRNRSYISPRSSELNSTKMERIKNSSAAEENNVQRHSGRTNYRQAYVESVLSDDSTGVSSGCHTSSDAVTVADSSEFGDGLHGYRAELIGDEKGERGWRNACRQTIQNPGATMREYRKEPAAITPGLTQNIHDNRVTVDTTEDNYREAFIKAQRRAAMEVLQDYRREPARKPSVK
ncbi:hypothetical protein GJ744_004627 [Endocarpon pusillum]|uniref:Fungal N-terminal domain-containing protein n=1 Tax=Endocarpon pusillum TaxID=364733 RepID=A0A8H7E7U9_9EURO|nr:hypothetical protein GJ744_004627 [Endocarpon pusillum]